jgi:4-amino-4-deoxy-L-arabinose transferase-like glycosyltransferase
VFNDPSWYFHFGHRALLGDVPYRDYIFQVGPLPIYVDALFQKLMGVKYIASMYAALFIHVLRVFVAWMLARRLAGGPAAALLCVFCAFDLYFGWAHHWSWQYAQLFLLLAGLCIVLASRATAERRARWWFALAGLSCGLVVSARQPTAMTSGAILLVATAILVVRSHLTRQRFIALWLGFAAAIVLVFGPLACAGALGSAIQQMFLDAPEKKSVSVVTAVLDAVSGGAAVIYQVPWWAGLLRYLALPIALVASVLYLAAHSEHRVPQRSLAAVLLPFALVIALATRYADLFYFADVPRCWFTATTALAALAPDRMRAWLRVEPMIAVALGALPLAADWALEMSYPGRGWGDWPALATGAVMLALSSGWLTARAKTVLCATLCAASLIHLAVFLIAGLNPFAKIEASDGRLDETQFQTRAPELRGMHVSESRQKALAWLSSQIPRGSTCFMYGTIPMIYDLLRCHNPTRLDVTIPDFLTARDAEDTIAILRAHPPDYLIAQEMSFMNPPLSVDIEGRVEVYSEINSDASKAMYLGLRHMLDQYDDLGLVGDAIGPALAKQAKGHWDTLQAVRLYHRKR